MVCYKERNSLAHKHNLIQPLKLAQAVMIFTFNCKVKRKGKINSITGQEGPQGK